MSGATPLLCVPSWHGQGRLLPNRPIGAIRSTELLDLQANGTQHRLGEF